MRNAEKASKKQIYYIFLPTLVRLAPLAAEALAAVDLGAF
jgi:hypothetical protein